MGGGSWTSRAEGIAGGGSWGTMDGRGAARALGELNQLVSVLRAPGVGHHGHLGGQSATGANVRVSQESGCGD